MVSDVGCDVAGRGADPAKAEQVVDELRQAGASAVADTTDLRDPDAGEMVVETALRSFGRVDALISSAGIVTFPGAIADATARDVRAHLEVDPMGSLGLVLAAWPHLETSPGGGRVVLTVSSAVFGVGTGLGYACAKGATLALGKSLARAGEGSGIAVNVVAPYGFTRMMTAFERPAAAVAAKEEVLAPEQVSAVALYLAHPGCTTSGELFGAGGGRVVRVVYAENEGYVDPGLGPEEVRGHWPAIMAEQGLTRVVHNKRFVDRFYDHVPGFREAGAARA